MEDEVTFIQVTSYTRKQQKRKLTPNNISLKLPNIMGLKSGALKGHIQDMRMEYSFCGLPRLTLTIDIYQKNKRFI